MKKGQIFVLVLCLLFTLAGCNSSYRVELDWQEQGYRATLTCPGNFETETEISDSGAAVMFFNEEAAKNRWCIFLHLSGADAEKYRNTVDAFEKTIVPEEIEGVLLFEDETLGGQNLFFKHDTERNVMIRVTTDQTVEPEDVVAIINSVTFKEL